MRPLVPFIAASHRGHPATLLPELSGGLNCPEVVVAEDDEQEEKKKKKKSLSQLKKQALRK